MPSIKVRIATMVVCAATSLPSIAEAQPASPLANAAAGGPVVPVPPAVFARTSDGRPVVRATRLTERIVVDGRIDEPVYEKIQSIGDFLQQEPAEGDPATEKTDVWVFFDDRHLYVTARCWDSQPERAVANELRRDGQFANENEQFGLLLDTFNDRRNAFVFMVTLTGGLNDSYVTGEGQPNRDWNTVWEAKTGRFDGGWSVELEIPFKSLRFQPGQGQTWGLNLRRIVRWKNEVSHLARVPAALGRRGFNQVSSAGTLVGMDLPAGRNFETKAYGTANLTTDRDARPQKLNDPGGDIGIDAKFGLTQGLTGDFSYNTDFAQVEVDQLQVNLTRFSTVYPEKREFFLEGQGIFSFGGTINANPNRGGVGPGFTPNVNPQPDDVPILFFSRRIGLHNGQPVPLDVGGRVTGKVGPYSIGLLDIRTGRQEAIGVEPTNFAAIRVKREILRRSSIGALFTHRSLSSAGPESSGTFGLDAALGFGQDLNVMASAAKASRPGTSGQDTNYRAQLDYAGDRYGLQLEQLFIDKNFDPDVGFVRRKGFRRSTAFGRFSPRPRAIPSIRKLTWDATIDYITDPGGRLESREAQTAFRAEMAGGDSFVVEYARLYEQLVEPFRIASNVSIPIGSYSFPEVRGAFYFGPQREMSGLVRFTHGRFYNGTRTGISTIRGRVEVTPQLGLEPGVTVDWIELPGQEFTSTLLSTRATYTITPRASLSALIQYIVNDHALGTNVRFSWEYSPGSDLFVAYTDNRDTLPRGFPALLNRALVVKLTRLFRL